MAIPALPPSPSQPAQFLFWCLYYPLKPQTLHSSKPWGFCQAVHFSGSGCFPELPFFKSEQRPCLLVDGPAHLLLAQWPLVPGLAFSHYLPSL